MFSGKKLLSKNDFSQKMYQKDVEVSHPAPLCRVVMHLAHILRGAVDRVGAVDCVGAVDPCWCSRPCRDVVGWLVVGVREL